jgi:hypothetical protein
MIPACFALIGYVCLWNFGVGAESGNTTQIVLSRPLGSTIANVYSAHWRASFYLQGYSRVDNDGLDPNAMQDACSEGNCIKYHRKCGDTVRPTNCDYIIASPTGRPELIHVEGDTEDAFTVAITFLRVLANPNGAIIPISAMNREATVPDPYRR